MIREEILEMEPGRKLDEEVFTSVIGEKIAEPPYVSHIPRYSTDISTAWEVVEKFERSNLYFEKSITRGKWEVGFVPNDFDHQFTVLCDTAPEAICKAALLAVTQDFKTTE